VKIIEATFLFQQMKISQILVKLQAFSGTRIFITASTRCRSGISCIARLGPALRPRTIKLKIWNPHWHTLLVYTTQFPAILQQYSFLGSLSRAFQVSVVAIMVWMCS